MDLSQIFTSENLIALVTLTSLEIVLGIDNIVFIAILVGKLPQQMRDKARVIGLALAMFMRIALLFAISAVMWLERYTLFQLPWPASAHAEPHGGSAAEGVHATADTAAAAPDAVHAVTEGAHAVLSTVNDFTGKDLILFLGGLFLVAKATYEIHHKIETGGAVEAVPHEHGSQAPKKAPGSFGSVLVQILLLDLVFSVDSVITAVGMAKALWVMVTAVVIAVGVMLAFSGHVARFVDRHPTVKMLALSFLILIGVMLIAESSGQHIPKGYIYFSMAFALGVEMLNIWTRSRSERRGAIPAPH